jgi:hypothetical protein
MWLRVLSAIVVAAVLGGCGSDDRTDSSAPQPTNTPPVTTTTDPTGAPPQVPWWSQGVLHVSEGTIPTRMRQVVARGGTTVIGRATSHGSTWRILRGDGLTDLYATRSLGSRPVLSANGRYAAWVTSVDTRRINDFEADTTFAVTAYDVGRGRVTGTTQLDSHTYCCDGGGVIDVVGVDAGGSVVLARYSDAAWIWRPGFDPVRLSGDVRTGAVAGNDAWPGGVSWTVGDASDDPAAFGRVGPDGVVTRVGRVPQSQDGLWSPDGSSYVYAPAVKERRVRPVVWSGGHRQALHAPRGAAPVAWESRGRVVLVVGNLDHSIRLVRCWAGDGRCEQAGPPLRHAEVPELLG